MTVNAIDHINIQTADMAATVRFFAEVLDLRAGDPPAGLNPARITWMFDASDRALVHLTTPGALEGIAPGPGPGRGTSALHHIALDCSGHGAMIARLDGLAQAYRCNDVPSIGLRQIFVTEPNGILLELNFRGE